MEELNNVVLNMNPKGFIYKYIKDSNMRSIYRNNINTNSILFKIILKFYLPGKSYFFGEWKKEIKSVKNIIIFDNGYRTAIAKYIKRKNKNCKIIVFCWNKLEKESPIINNRKYIDEIYSFDIGDVEKYNFKFNNSFYTKDLILNETKKEYDIFFLGQNKNREKKINEIEKACNELKIQHYFKIIKSKFDYVDYDTYLRLLNKSKVVLDITKEGQRGLTVRTMECLFLKKKLITDNKEIKRFDFYRKNNIFILGEDNMEKFKDFIESPYEEVAENIINEYDYKNWCLRMLEGKEQEYKKQ